MATTTQLRCSRPHLNFANAVVAVVTILFVVNLSTVSLVDASTDFNSVPSIGGIRNLSARVEESSHSIVISWIYDSADADGNVLKCVFFFLFTKLLLLFR